MQNKILNSNRSVSIQQTRSQKFVLPERTDDKSVTNVAFAGNRKFIKAAEEGDLGYIIQKINSTSKDILADLLNGKNYKGNSALILAIRAGNNDIVKELLKHPELDVNIKDKEGWTSLYLAVESENLELVKDLLANPNINVNMGAGPKGYTPLTQASSWGRYYKIFTELLKHPKIDVNKKSNGGLTPLMNACGSGCINMVKDLLARPEINVNLLSSLGTALQIACHYVNSLDVVNELLKKPNIDLNEKRGCGSAIMCAVRDRHFDIVDRLLDCEGIDLTSKDDIYHLSIIELMEKYTAPQELINKASQRILGKAPDAPADATQGKISEVQAEASNNDVKADDIKPAENDKKKFPFNIDRIERELMSSDGFLRNEALDDIEKYIESDDFSSELTDNLFGGNIIHIALLSRDEKVKRLILKAQARGVNINTPDKLGRTPLMCAIKNLITAKSDDEIFTDLAVIKFILDQNPDINVQDNNKQTAFHFACISKSVPLLNLILSKHPDVFVVDVTGKRACDYLKTDEMKDLYRKAVCI